jgi:SH3-like domain-containing protein
MARRFLVVLFLLAPLACTASARASPDGSGLPVPRFVSLKASEANMRTGPGERYPIKWIYQRPGLPLEIVGEYHHWRRVRDVQGTEGWMHKTMLSGARSVIVTGAPAALRSEADAAAPLVARLDALVVGELLRCPQGSMWCAIAVDGFRGWLGRQDMWGVYRDETVE